MGSPKLTSSDQTGGAIIAFGMVPKTPRRGGLDFVRRKNQNILVKPPFCQMTLTHQPPEGARDGPHANATDLSGYKDDASRDQRSTGSSLGTMTIQANSTSSPSKASLSYEDLVRSIDDRLQRDTAWIEELGRGGREKEALRVLASLKESAESDASLTPILATYNAVLIAISTKGYSAEASALMAEMRSVGIQPNAVSYTALIRAHARDRKAAEAEKLLSEMTQHGFLPTTATFNMVLSGWMSKGDWSSAVRILLNMMESNRDDALPDALSIILTIRACERQEQWQTALDMLDKLKPADETSKRIGYHYAIAVCRSDTHNRKGAWRRCSKLLEEMTELGLRPDVITVRYLIESASKAGELSAQAAMKLISRVEAAGVERSVSTFNEVLDAFVKSRNWRAAISLLERMSRHKVKPDVQSYALALKVCRLGNVLDPALRLLKEMETGNGIEPNMVIYNSILCQIREISVKPQDERGEDEHSRDLVKLARDLLSKMDKTGGSCTPNQLSFTVVAQVCVNEGQAEQALRIFELIQSAALEGRFPMNTATYRLGLLAASKLDDGLATSRMISNITKFGIELDESLVHLAAVTLGRTNLHLEAARLRDRAQKEGILLTTETLTSMLSACVMSGGWREALETLELVRRNPVSRRSSQTRREILGPEEGYCRQEIEWVPQAATPLETAKRESTASLLPYVLAMMACNNANRVDAGLSVFDMIIEDEVPIQGSAFIRTTLLCCSRVHTGQRGAQIADRTRKMAAAHGVRLNVKDYTLVVQAYGNVGRLKDALAVLKCIDEEDVKPDTRIYSAMMNACADNGAWREAVQLLQRMRFRDGKDLTEFDSERNGGTQKSMLPRTSRPPQPDVSTYSCAARACSLAGRGDDALRVMEYAKSDGLVPNRAMYASVMRAFSQGGEWKKSVALFREAVRDGFKADVISYNQVLRTCADAVNRGRSHGVAGKEAMSLFKMMIAAGRQPDILSYERLTRACSSSRESRPCLDMITAEAARVERKVARKYDRLYDELCRLRICQFSLLARHGRWQDALDIFDDMKAKYGPPPDSRLIVSVCYACADSGQWAIIGGLLSEALSEGNTEMPVKHQHGMHRAHLSSLVKAGLWQQAVLKLRFMYNIAGSVNSEHHSHKGFEVDNGKIDKSATQCLAKTFEPQDHKISRDFESVMLACLMAGASQNALSILHDFRALPRRPRPNSNLYAVALSACGGEANWSLAQELLAEMKAIGGAMSPQRKHFDSAAAAAAASDAIRGRLDLGAASFLRRSRSDEATNGANIGKRLCSDGSALKKLIDDMADTGTQPTWSLFLSISRAYEAQRQSAYASEGILALIKDIGPRPLSTHSKGSEVADVNKLYSRMLHEAGRYIKRGGRRSLVRDVLASARATLQHFGLGPRLLSAATSSFVKIRDWKGAIDTAHELVWIYAGDHPDYTSGVGDSNFEPGSRECATECLYALSAAVDLSANSDHLKEAAELADKARIIAQDMMQMKEQRNDKPINGRKSRNMLSQQERARFGGLDRSAHLSLIAAYERAGNASRAKQLREKALVNVSGLLGLEKLSGGGNPSSADQVS